MTIKVALEHRTVYSFDRPTKIYPHVVRLRPAPHSRTPIEAYSLTVDPGEHFLNWQQDAFSNYLARNYTEAIQGAQRFLSVHPGNRDAP